MKQLYSRDGAVFAALGVHARVARWARVVAVGVAMVCAAAGAAVEGAGWCVVVLAPARAQLCGSC